MKNPTLPKERPFIDEHLDPQIGDLIKLYNLYREITIEEPSVVGVYMGKGYSGQFSYYEILVVKNYEFQSYYKSDADEGKMQRFLINDFIMCKCA